MRQRAGRMLSSCRDVLHLHIASRKSDEKYCRSKKSLDFLRDCSSRNEIGFWIRFAFFFCYVSQG